MRSRNWRGWKGAFSSAPSLPSSGTPKGVDFTAVRDLLLSVEGVEALHSLHIWALTVAQPVLSVHIAVGEWWGHSGYGEGERQPEAWGIPDRSKQPQMLQCPCFEPGPMLSASHTLLYLIATIPFIDGETEVGGGGIVKSRAQAFTANKWQRKALKSVLFLLL